MHVLHWQCTEPLQVTMTSPCLLPLHTLAGTSRGFGHASSSGSATSSAAAGNASTYQPATFGLAHDSITIDSTSGPWDGPHPGLAAPDPSSGSQNRRRAPLGLVRLPQSLLPPPRSHHGRASGIQARPVSASDTVSQQQCVSARQFSHSSSAATGMRGSAVATAHAQAESSTGGAIASMPAVSTASAHNPSANVHASTAQPTMQRQVATEQSGQDLSSHQEAAVPQDGSRHPSAEAEAVRHGVTTEMQTHAGLFNAPAPAQTTITGQPDAIGNAVTPAPYADHGQRPEPQGHTARVHVYPEGQLGDLPDRPGHLATVEQCRAANGGVCWHLLQMAIKARQIAERNALVRL